MALVRHGTGPAWHWSDVALVRHGTGPSWHWSGCGRRTTACRQRRSGRSRRRGRGRSAPSKRATSCARRPQCEGAAASESAAVQLHWRRFAAQCQPRLHSPVVVGIERIRHLVPTDTGPPGDRTAGAVLPDSEAPGERRQCSCGRASSGHCKIHPQVGRRAPLAGRRRRSAHASRRVAHRRRAQPAPGQEGFHADSGRRDDSEARAPCQCPRVGGQWFRTGPRATVPQCQWLACLT
jgi:hypothetical protein